MSKKSQYSVQCKLVRDDGNTQTAWIPLLDEIKPGSLVEVLEDGLFWEVVEMYSVLPTKLVETIQANVRNHRKSTDI